MGGQLFRVMEESEVKQGIHPEYMECKVTCSCGNAFVTRATVPEMHLELCSECHPFYTGQQKFVDTGGRVGRFERKFGEAADQVLEREEQAKQERIAAAQAAAERARKEREERLAKREERRRRAAEKAARDAQFEDEEPSADAVTGAADTEAAEEPAPEQPSDEAASAGTGDAQAEAPEGESPEAEESAGDAAEAGDQMPADGAEEEVTEE
ncbi:MAG: hypothetical protein Kow0056_16220 [Coriobacteriia bacterium]